MALADSMSLALDIVSELSHIHRQGLVHQDLKPGNVMVTPDGSPKLLDFGIAGLLDEQGDASDTELTRQAGRRHISAISLRRDVGSAGGLT